MGFSHVSVYPALLGCRQCYISCLPVIAPGTSVATSCPSFPFYNESCHPLPSSTTRVHRSFQQGTVNTQEVASSSASTTRSWSTQSPSISKQSEHRESKRPSCLFISHSLGNPALGGWLGNANPGPGTVGPSEDVKSGVIQGKEMTCSHYSGWCWHWSATPFHLHPSAHTSVPELPPHFRTLAATKLSPLFSHPLPSIYRSGQIRAHSPGEPKTVVQSLIQRWLLGDREQSLSKDLCVFWLYIFILTLC